MFVQELNKKYAKAYELGLTTKPNPDILTPVTDDLYGQCDYEKDIDPVRDIMEANKATIRGWDDAAKKAKTMVGRKIAEGRGDGYAIYVITKENKTTVQITVCRNIGDDWTIPYWGEQTNIKKSYALKYLKPSLFGNSEV